MESDESLEGEEVMEEHQEVSRHKPPRQDCVDAGFDYPHEGWGLVILAGEWHCPACEPRAREKDRINIQNQMLVEQRRANDLKAYELTIGQPGEREEEQFRPRTVTKIVLPEKQVKQAGKGGVRID